MSMPRSKISISVGAALALVAVMLTLLGGLYPSAALEASSSSQHDSFTGAVASAGSVNSNPTPPVNIYPVPTPDKSSATAWDDNGPSIPTLRSFTDVANPTTWRVLLLVYRNTDVDYVEGGVTKHMTTSLSQAEIDKALAAFHQFTGMVSAYSANEARLDTTVIDVTRSVNSITASGNAYWLSPTDSARELDFYAPPGTYDSVIVLWQPCNNSTGTCIPPVGWGMAMGCVSDWTNGATFASFIFGTSAWWDSPTIGQLYLWGWLTGVMNFYAGLGYLQWGGV